MLKVRRLRVSNPHKRKQSRNSRRRARRNPGEVLIVANPQRRRRIKKSYSKNRRSRRNPFVRTKIRRRGHRRNPSDAMGVSSKNLLELSLGAAAGMLGSKAAAQAILQGNNTGWMGLGATAIAGGVIAYATKKFVGKEAAIGVIAGTGGAIALALWQQYVSGTGTGAMSGLGDPDMAGILGEYRPGVIPMPSGFNALPNPAPAGRNQRSRG